MSDEAAVVSESVPTSTADVAEAVIESYEASDPTDVVTGNTPIPDADPEPAKEPAPGVAESEVDGLLREAGFTEQRRPDGRENRIPYSKVRKIIDNGLEKGRTAWETEKQTLARERDEYRQYVEQFRTALTGDEKQFLSEVAKIDPRYAKFLAEQPAPAPVQVSEMPPPDVPLPDGGRTYSVEGLQKLIEWAVDNRMMPKVDERLKPLTERDQQIQQAEQRRQLEAKSRERVGQALQQAKAWPLWDQLEPEILAELQQDTETSRARGERPQMTLRQAYLEVASRHQTPDKVRERVLAELKQAPKSTSVSRGATDAPKAPGPTSTADIAARVMDRLERGA